MSTLWGTLLVRANYTMGRNAQAPFVFFFANGRNSLYLGRRGSFMALGVPSSLLL